MSKRHSLRTGGVYVIRTDKPSAIIGLPVIGRHFAYVGETNSYRWRRLQHLEGGGRYNAPQKPFSDLRPKFYRALPLPDIKWLRRTVETIVMLLVWPVYNHQKNLWNPRRISLSRAQRMRVGRNRDGMLNRVGHLIARMAFRGSMLAMLFVFCHYWWA